MKTYQRNAVCPKCAHDGIKTIWCEGLISVQLGVSSVCRQLLNAKHKRNATVPEIAELSRALNEEHMERRCECCFYYWLERPLDQASALEQLAAQAE